MPLPYRKVKDLYDTLHNAGVTTKSLADWSQEQNALTQSDLYTEGVNDNLLKQVSTNIDQLLEATGLPEIGGEIGESYGGFFGAPEKGRVVGEKLARGAVNMAPMFIPGAGWGVTAARLGGMGALAGAETYTETDSPAAGLISGATAATMPGVARFAEQQVLRRTGGKLLAGPISDLDGNVLRQLKEFVPQTIGQGVKSTVTGQVAAAGLGEVSSATQAGFDPDRDYEFSPVDILLNNTLGQVPFAATYLTTRGRVGFGSKTSREHIASVESMLEASRQRIEIKEVRKQLETKTPIESIPTVVEPEVAPEVRRENAVLLSKLRGEQVRVKDDTTLAPEEKIERINTLLQEETQLARETQPASRATLFGDSIAPDSERQQVVGRELKSNGKWRAIMVEDIPANPEDLRGRVVSYSTAYEPNPTKRGDGMTVFGLPDSQWRTIKTQDEWQPKRRGPETPELPHQEHEATREEMFSHIQDLARVEQDVDGAETIADLQQAAVRLNNVRLENNLPPTTDMHLKKEVQRAIDSDVDPQDAVKVAVKVQTRRTARQLETKKSVQEQERDAPPLTPDQAAEITAQMGGKGFSIKTEDKLSHKTTDEIVKSKDSQLLNLVDETAVRVVASRIGRAAYEAWADKDKSTAFQEAHMFQTLVGEFGRLEDVDVGEAATFLNQRDGVPIPEAKSEVTDFLQRPHVQVWKQQLETELSRIRETNAAPMRPERPAGSGWLFSMGPYDEPTNTLNLKHKLPKDAMLREATFKNMAGVGRPLTDGEIELYRRLVPEAFDGKGNVDVRKLDKGLKEKGPVVEVKKLGKSDTPENYYSTRRGQLEHELDTIDPHWRLLTRNEVVELSPRAAQISTELDSLPTGITGASNDATRYSFLAPKPESEMQGYVEGLVRVPTEHPAAQFPGEGKVQYRGPHFGSEDTNVLSFFRGYEEALPDGTKAFHVIEVQSDWGQQMRKKQEDPTGLGYDPSEATPGHSLLRVYETLALKAAIRHAKEVGATKVILSDAETAMMTEGHDRATPPPYQLVKDLQGKKFRDEVLGKTGVLTGKYTKAGNQFDMLEVKFDGEQFPEHRAAAWLDIEGVGKVGMKMESEFQIEQVVPGPTQAAGMRLHYDQTLPSAMEKLTGVKGENVALGAHKSAIESYNSGQQEKPVGSPVFRDPSGAPKTQITGRIYDISQTPDAFTLTERNRAVEVPFEPQPDDLPILNELGLDRGAAGLLEFVTKSPDPIFKAVSRALRPFTESLGRTTVRIVDDADVSFVRNLGNRKLEIVLGKGILSARRDTQDYVISHELIHGLTLAEIDNPTKATIVKELTDLRQRLVDKLPAEMRTAYDNAVKTDWYRRYSNGEVEFDTLFPGREPYTKGKIIYGLLTDAELVSQGFSEKVFRNYMRSFKAKEGNWFSRFSNVVKRLVGLGEDVTGTVFEEFLSKADRLLGQGEKVATFHNYANRFFENLGLPKGQIDGQTQRAMGLVLDNINPLSRQTIVDALQSSHAIRNPEYIRANQGLVRMLNEKGDDFMTFGSVMDELGYDVSKRGLDDYAYQVLVEGENQQAIDLLPPSVTSYLFAQARDMQQVLSVLESATTDSTRRLLGFGETKGLRSAVQDTTKSLKELLQIAKQHEEAVTIVEGLNSIAPDGYTEMAFADPVRAAAWLPEADKVGRKNAWHYVKDFIQPLAQLAREDQRAAEIYTRGRQLGSNVRRMMSESLKPFGIDIDGLSGTDPTVTKESTEKFHSLIRNTKLVSAADKWVYQSQAKGKISGEIVMLPDSNPDVAKILAPLNAGERALVNEIVSKRQVSNRRMQAHIIDMRILMAAADGSVVISKDTGLKTKDNVTLAESLIRAALVDRNDVAEMQQFVSDKKINPSGLTPDAMIQAVQGRMTLDSFNNLAKFTLNVAEQIKHQRDLFAANPDWASAQDYGKYRVEWTRGNRTFRRGVESRKEAEVLAEGGKIVKFEPNRKGDDTPPTLGFDTIGVTNRMRELEANEIAILRNKGVSEEDLALKQRYSAVEQFITEQSYKGGVSNIDPQARRLTKGAEELPFLSNHFSWIQATSNFWSRQLLRSQARAYLLDPEIVAAPELQTKLKTHIENMLQNDPGLGQFINRFASTWFLGFNPASTITNGSQSFTTHVAELTSLTGKPLNSYNRIIKAHGELIGHKLDKKDWLDKDHEKLMHDAVVDGHVDQSMYDDRALDQELLATNAKRIFAGNRPQTLGQKLNTAYGNYSRVAMGMFKSVEKINNQVALLASFDYYREQGLGYEEAKQQAYLFNDAVNYGGGRSQRGVGAFSGRGPVLRTVAMTATSLQSYVLGSTFQLARYIQRGFFRPAGVTPHEVYSARKAAVQMLATQLTLAGTLGLPFVSGAMALLDTAFPELEVNKNVREWINSVFSDDEEQGSVLTDIAMTGLPSMLGWDMQSRFSMGNTVPGVSEINGFQPELLLGPPINIIKNFVNGGQKVFSGDPHAVESFVPPAVKKAVQLARSGGTIRDYRERPIFNPTLGETAGILLGFQPKRLSDFNVASRLSKQTQDLTTQRAGQYHQQLAEEVLKGNFGTARQQLLDKTQEQPDYNPIEGVRAVARAAEELTFPRDLRREGTRNTSSERSRLLASFSGLESVTQPTEVERLRFRKDVEARLGLRLRTSRRELRTVELMDELKVQNPNATRSELRRTVEVYLRRHAPQTLEPIDE